MKQFNIKNVVNGSQFQVIGDALGPMQPEWGPNPVITVIDLSADPQWVLTQIQQARVNEYVAKSAGVRDVAVALYEWLVEGRPDAIMAIHPKRMRVKNDNLKPGELPHSEEPPILPDLTKLLPKK